MTKIDKEFLIGLVGRKIRFNKSIEEYEMYAEEGMHATVTKWNFDNAHVAPTHRIWVDFSPYEAENHRRQNANYYDKSGRPVLTAVEAGYYLPIDDFYIDSEIETLPFTIVE